MLEVEGLLKNLGNGSAEAMRLCQELDFDYALFKSYGIEDRDIIAYLTAYEEKAGEDTRETQEVSKKQPQKSLDVSLDLQSLLSEMGGESGTVPTLGIIAAAIAGQHLLSEATNREFEGVKTKDAFSGHYATEPWLAYLGDVFGLDVSPGEKFDAAMMNKDYGLAAKRFSEAANQWANPIQALGYGLNKKWFGQDVANILDPASYLFSLISKL